MESQLKNIRVQYEISEAAEAEELNLSDEGLFDPVLVRSSWYRPAMAGVRVEPSSGISAGTRKWT